MNWKQLPLGPLQTNCYVLYDNDKNAVIIDPAGDADKLLTYLQENDLHPVVILLTHAHFDHIGALDTVRDAYSIPVYLHDQESDWLGDAQKNGSGRMMPEAAFTTKPADHLLHSEGTLQLGSFEFQWLHTPGHSPGSVSYWHKETNTVFSGDVLFSGGVGRTDLYGGDMDTLLASIHEQLLELPENTVVACGHGPFTDIEAEMDSNPFINGFGA